MNEPKPFASLSSGLLARKGAAKPAMRPQGYGYGSLEDLGWNDMGHAGPVEHVPSSIAALTPAPGGHRADHHHGRDEEPADDNHPWGPEEVEAHEEPAVLGQQRALEQSFEPPVVPEPEGVVVAGPEIAPEPDTEPEAEQSFEPEPTPEPAPVVSLPKRKAPPARPAASDMPARAKAAFTLRLDPDRHLRLRLACAVTRRSAQQIVTGALDEYLSSLPELEALAEHVPAKAGKR